MDFDETNKTIIESLTTEEAQAFIKFLLSEIARHQRDIEEAEVLIQKVKIMFKLEEIKNEPLLSR